MTVQSRSLGAGPAPRRSFILLLALCTGLAGALAGCVRSTAVDVTPQLPSRHYSIEQFLGTTSYVGAAFSADRSKVLVSSDATGVFNAYALPVDGGPAEQLTFSSDDSIFAADYFPHDDRFLYTQDDGGDELTHVFVMQPDGEPVDLTPGEGLKASFLGWSADGRYFYIGSNERDERFFDVYQYAATDYERELIFENDGGFTFSDISPDQRWLLLGKTVTTADSDVYLYDRESAEIELLTPHEGEANHQAAGFRPDGSAALIITSRDREFRYLVEQPLDGGEWTVVRQPDWDVQFAGYSENGRYRVVGINEDARTRLEIEDLEAGRPLALPDVPDAEITSVSISADESWMAFYASSSRTPRDLFVVGLDGGTPLQLTRSLDPEIEPDDLVDAEVVRFDSLDGTEIPGILYRPHQATPETPAPALVWVHGGPGGQSRVGYSSLIQYLVNHGYVVYAVNNRGSSGYGKTFFHMDDRAHGKGDLDDCVAAGEMLRRTGYVDPDQVGIIGGSYGGFMVLAALAFRPEAFAAGIDIFGVSNWHRTVQSIPPWWESFREALEQEMGDFDDEEYFRSISPLFHAENIRRPLMVLQGANDPRVLQAESDEIVEAVRANGVPVEYLVFDDEGHGFLKRENRAEGYRAILEFADRHLRGEGGEAGSGAEAASGLE